MSLLIKMDGRPWSLKNKSRKFFRALTPDEDRVAKKCRHSGRFLELDCFARARIPDVRQWTSLFLIPIGVRTTGR